MDLLTNIFFNDSDKLVILRKRLLKNIDKSLSNNGCHIWIGKTGTSGSGNGFYGKICICGRKVFAHRVAWVLEHGPIPVGLCVCHECDNPSCCNVEHLFLGTPKVNSLDCINKGRFKAGGPNGELNGISKLTEGDVINIFHDSRKQLEIAQSYGIAQTGVSKIKLGQTWKHLNLV